MINIIKTPSSEITVSPKEVAVYLGYYSAKIDAETEKLIAGCTEEFLKAADFKACFKKVPVRIENGVDLGFIKVQSRSLEKNLRGCDYAYVFAATTGFGAHRLLSKYSALSPLKGIVSDCVGSAAIEAFCDKINFSFENPDFLRPRFSPGYGDLPIENQKDILSFLDAGKTIGLTLTDSLMMIPVKSVTAIIGIGKEKNKCKGPGCMICSGVNCPYRD